MVRRQRTSPVSVIAAAVVPVGAGPAGAAARPQAQAVRAERASYAPRGVGEVRPPSGAPSGRPPVARGPVKVAASVLTGRPAGLGEAAAAIEPVRRIVRDLRPRARVMAMVSGKGGVGKTNLSVNLAIALAGAGRRVLLVDADLGLANVDLVLGRRPRGDLGHVLAGRMMLEEIVQEGPAGIHWIPGAAHMPAVARIDSGRREALLKGLTALETDHDYVLLDAPAGIGEGVLHLARQADELLLVTTPEPPAMMDAYALLKAAVASGPESLGRVWLIVNMVTHRRDAERVHGRLREAAERFLGLRVDLLGHVFCDGHVGRAVQKQEPVVLAYPHSQAAWCVNRLAASVLEGTGRPEKGRFAFFRRLANLFGTGNR